VAVEQFEKDPPAGGAPPAPRYPWCQKTFAVVYVFFCFEIGVFLVLFPWLEMWDRNYFAGFVPFWPELWNNPYFRGAVSGLGLVDIGISFAEMFRLRRFSGRAS
jgi:hypothetical protein